MTVPNQLLTVEVRRGYMPETEVTFYRRNRDRRKYFPNYRSLERLEKHLAESRILLGEGWMVVIKDIR